LRISGNMLLKSRAERGEWMHGLKIKKVPEQKANVVFHAGCRLSYDEGQRQVARIAVSILNQAGVDVGVMGESETCCGGRAYNMGYRDDFFQCANSNIAAWDKAGAQTVVTSCADCYHSFKRFYPALGSQFEVLHMVEYLDRLIHLGTIKPIKEVPLTVTYHDPCHLGRQGEPYIPWNGKEKKIFNQIVVYEPRKPRYNGAWGIYDPPRKILRSIPGLELVEMERIREAAWCCGAGAGVREAFPEFADWTAAERLEEAKATGAQAVVSACGWCEKIFLDSIGNSNDEGIKVLDIVELVQQAL
jgi:Fe-S oxidoreductase